MRRSTVTFEAAPALLSDATTLEAIFAVNARRHGDALAVLDPPDRDAVIDGSPRRLGYAELDRMSDAVARRLTQLGLPRGSVIGVQLPNTVEQVVSMLAILRAGMAAAPLPLLWRRSEATRALARAGAKALIVGGSSAGDSLAELGLHLAADTFNIRFVCAFGDDLPDGVIALGGDDDAGPDDAEPDLAGSRAQARASDVAIVTFDAGADGPVPVPHTHAELLVGGLAVVQECGLPERARIVATMLPSSFAVLSATFVPWLLSGGTLALHQPFDPDLLAAQLAEVACDALVLPGPLAAPIADAGLCEGDSAPARVLAVWRAPERQASSAAWTRRPALSDLLAFGELGHVVLRRDNHGNPTLPRIGPVTAPADEPDAPIVITLGRSEAGTLSLAGPMAASNETAGDTGYACSVDAESAVVTLTGAQPGLVSIGGYRFAIGELQDVVGEVERNGVLAVLPDLLAGEKLAGFSADVAAMRRELARRGVSPLVAEAFRQREAIGEAPAA
jgi:hypothetical protein